MDTKFILKYAVDRFFSACLFFLSIPLIALIGFGMWIEGLVFPESKGPLFYRETRISKGKPFGLYKFRVLKADALEKAAKEGSVWFVQFDKKNTTFVGKILIQCYLDEMPQLFNILLGQMSFVGPRPRAPFIYRENLEEGYGALTYLKGGITGPAQLAKGMMDNPLPLSEAYLARCHSYPPIQLLKYDLGVMWKSVFKLMKAEGL